jgi:hypothetical protein
MNTLTLSDVERHAGRTCYGHVSEALAEIEVPVLDGPQAQGDLLIVPVARTAGAGAVDVTAPVDVIPAVNGGHAHTLVAPDGGCRIALRSTGGADDLVLALVDAEQPVYLLHAEHGATGLAPGSYELRGQREFDAAEARRVAD